MQPELVLIRQDIHANPEVGMKEERTPALVAAKLKLWGITVTENVGVFGVVGTLKSNRPGTHSIALRADMDALQLTESTKLSYASRTPGAMHACGHDGHTAMLLGAAKYLAENRDTFYGTIYFIFQPAEESLSGAMVMIEDQLFERFPFDAIYGLHNDPNIPFGEFATRSGPFLAAADKWIVTFRGTGGHGALPHLATDINIVQAEYILSLQTIISRNTAPIDSGIISVGALESGSFTSINILPKEVHIGGITRTFLKETRNMIERRIKELAHGLAASFGCEAQVQYHRLVCALDNHAEQTVRAVKAAERVVGTTKVNPNMTRTTGSEDFSAFLERKPGAFMYIGNGTPTYQFHSPTYDFNDAIIPFGVAYWISLVQQELKE
ncbi:unnamed protein product [Rotaria sp. Silwood2]|nr:unnamed protein product [Rotaria sp. Silwood2]